MQSIDFQNKEQGSDSSKKELVAFKAGTCIGAFFGGILINCEYFMPSTSQFVEKRFLLPCLLFFLLQLSGVLLVFSIETKGFALVDFSKKYVELDEKKENESETGDSAKKLKEKSDLSGYIHSSVLANEHIVSEESVGPEEVKFYSPRESSTKEINTRKLNSARPKLEPSFNFPDSVVETKEHERNEGEGKRTHISFIEEELEIIHENSKPENPPVLKPEPKLTEEQKNIRFAVKTRILITVSCSLLMESLPLSVFLAFKGTHRVLIGGTLALVFIIATVSFYLFSEKMMEKYSIYKQMTWFSVSLFVILIIFPVFQAFSNSPLVLLPFWTVLVFAHEGCLPCSNVLLSDSVSCTEREKYLDKVNFLCIACKVIASCFSTVFLYLLSWHQVGLAFYGILFGLLYWVCKKAPALFPMILECPYKT
jgi:hypothetical protein